MKKLLPTSVFFFLLVSCPFSPSLSLAQNQTSTVAARLAYEGQFINCEEEAYLIRCLTPECDDYSEIYWDEPHGNEQGYYYFVFYNVPYGEYAVHIKGCDHAKRKTLLTTGETRIIVDQPDELKDVVVVETEPCLCEPPPPPVDPGVPPGFFPSGSLTCTPDLVGDQDSRPYYNIPSNRACDLCNLTGLFCPSCATSFTVHDTVTYTRGDGTPEPPHCVETLWGGTVKIDPTETKIPFVGKKGEESEEKYLADYFEGTNEYYTNADKNYPMYWRDWINYAGVWRKLSPMAYQDQLKKQMVERALVTSDVRPEGVHNYQLEYTGRICWDLPLLMDALIAYAESRGIPLVGPFIKFVYERSSYCVFEGSRFDIWLTKKAIDAFNLISQLDITYFHYVDASGKLTSLEGHYPPDPFEEDYAEKWNEWKKSDGGKWYKLWQVVPMFSHEDTPGQISPYLGYKSNDEPKFIPPNVEKVPHVARLYEASREVNNMLLPYQEGGSVVQKKTEPIIASAQENVLGEKTLLAQGDPCKQCPKLSIANPGISNGMVYYTYQLCHDCPGVIGDVFVGPCGGASQMHNIPPPCFSTTHPAIAPPIPVSCPGTANICITFKCDGCPGCPGTWEKESCQVTVDESCNITDTTCGAVPVEPPVCGVSGPMPVMECEKEAITDTNDNDELCCDPININLRVVDAFENPEYDKCREEGITCNPPGCIEGEPGCRCHDPCDELVEQSVNRRFGINLLHPYLTDIWEQTGLAETAGLFNFFRPEDENIPNFREIDASSEITYSYPGGVSPPIGKFYFNYLGGVQLAKEWVTRALMPWKE